MELTLGEALQKGIEAHKAGQSLVTIYKKGLHNSQIILFSISEYTRQCAILYTMSLCYLKVVSEPLPDDFSQSILSMEQGEFRLTL